jgi:hypothetical protein
MDLSKIITDGEKCENIDFIEKLWKDDYYKAFILPQIIFKRKQKIKKIFK